MSIHKRTYFFLGVMILSLMLITACSTAAPEATTIIETVVVVEKVVETVVVEKEVEKEVLVTPTAIPCAPEGELVFALTTNFNAIDPQFGADFNAWNAGLQMFDRLIHTTEDGQFEGELAESWEVSEDGLEYIFHLRDDVTYHNGEPFNAEAMVYSWERNRPEDMYNSWYWSKAETMEAVDEYTIKITRSEPDPLFFVQLAQNYMPLPPLYNEEVGLEGFLEAPMGTGPFVFEEWARGDHLTMVANPNYWRECYPLLEKIVIKPIPEASTRIAALKTGEVDIITRLTSDEAESLLGIPEIKVLKYPVDRVFYLAFNNMTTGVGTPVEDRNVRLAMNYAVDVQAIIDAFFSGHAVQSSSLVGSQNMGYDGAEPYPYDPEKAKELLAEAGYPNGFDIGMACPDGAFSHINEVCQALANYLDEVGINVDLEFMETTLFWDLEYEKALPPLFVDSWSGTTGEANQRITGMLGRDASYASWFDEKYAAMNDNILTTMDRDEREQLYREIQVMMREDPPFIYLYEPVTFEAYRTRVFDYMPSAYEEFELWHVGVSDE